MSTSVWGSICPLLPQTPEPLLEDSATVFVVNNLTRWRPRFNARSEPRKGWGPTMSNRLPIGIEGTGRGLSSRVVRVFRGDNGRTPEGIALRALSLCVGYRGQLVHPRDLQHWRASRQRHATPSRLGQGDRLGHRFIAIVNRRAIQQPLQGQRVQ
jgi:hypothetical protein